MKSIIFNQHQVNHALKNEEGMFRVVIKPCSAHPKSLCKKERGAHIGIEFMKDGFFWRPVGGCELQPFPYYNGELSKDRSFADYAKFKVGETIFVKESFCHDPRKGVNVTYKQELLTHNLPEEFMPSWKPAQHMKQEHSRLTLRIKSVKVERLAHISYEDCWKEGIVYSPECCQNYIAVPDCNGNPIPSCCNNPIVEHPQPQFEQIWNSTHKKPEEKFEANPFVFCFSYEVVR